MKTKCCGYKPTDPEYIEGIIQELVYFDAWNNKIEECEKMEQQGRKWLEELLKAQKKERK